MHANCHRRAGRQNRCGSLKGFPHADELDQLHDAALRYGGLLKWSASGLIGFGADGLSPSSRKQSRNVLLRPP